MAQSFEEKGLKQLRRIEKELEEIKDRTGNPKRMFVGGLFYGAGAFFGGIVAIVGVTWLLSFLGVIPGLTEATQYLSGLVDQGMTK